MAGGGPYWCGFIITASWATYVNYGDSRLIEHYYPYMQKWLEYVDEYTVNGLLKTWPNTDYRNWYLGDWALLRPGSTRQILYRLMPLIIAIYRFAIKRCVR